VPETAAGTRPERRRRVTPTFRDRGCAQARMSGPHCYADKSDRHNKKLPIADERLLRLIIRRGDIKILLVVKGLDGG
jgi:hypothetical protein